MPTPNIYIYIYIYICIYILVYLLGSIYKSYIRYMWPWTTKLEEYLLRNNYLKIWNLRVQKQTKKLIQNTEKKIIFEVVQIKFSAMHITNQKWFWYIYSRKIYKIS